MKLPTDHGVGKVKRIKEIAHGGTSRRETEKQESGSGFDLVAAVLCTTHQGDPKNPVKKRKASRVPLEITSSACILGMARSRISNSQVARRQNHGDLEQDENAESGVVDGVTTELMSFLERRPQHCESALKGEQQFA